MALVQLHELGPTSVGDSDRFGNDKKNPSTWLPPWRFRSLRRPTPALLTRPRQHLR